MSAPAVPVSRAAYSSEELSLDLYRRLYLIRAAERRIIEHYGEDEMRTPMHMSVGQEAVSVGLCSALAPEDQVYGSYRSHALFLAKTNDPERFFGELYGRVNGTARGKAGSMHLAAPDAGLLCASAVVGSTIPAAVGTAFANQRLRNGKRCAVLFGDGALEEGGFWESLNAACAMRIPVVFVCEDNGYAVHTPKTVRHGFDRILDVVAQFRCGVFSTEGSTDVEVIRRSVAAALQCSAGGSIPAFVHVLTHRYLDHIGIEADRDIRSVGEDRRWRVHDPLVLQRSRLTLSGYEAADLQAEERQIEERIEAALWRARAAPAPGPEELLAGVFHEAAA